MPSLQPQRLLRIKGVGQKVNIKEMPFHVGSLNGGDVFLIDQGNSLKQWIGEEANEWELNAANTLIQDIRAVREEQGVEVEVETARAFEEGEEDVILSLPKHKTYLWGLIKSPQSIKSSRQGGRDCWQKPYRKRLHKVEFTPDWNIKSFGKSFQVNDLFTNTFTEGKALVPDQVVILDTGLKVFVWIGQSNKLCRLKPERVVEIGRRIGELYLQKRKRPGSIPVVVEAGTKERADFMSHFQRESSFGKSSKLNREMFDCYRSNDSLKTYVESCESASESSGTPKSSRSLPKHDLEISL